MKKPYDDQRGFTLIELVLVIGIIGIIIVLTLPSLYKINSLDIKSVQKMIVRDIKYAQETALYDEIRISVLFFKDKYVVTGLPTESPILQQELPSKFSLSSNFDSGGVTYNSKGAPTMGGTIYVYEGKGCKIITVAPGTGRVKYYD